ncbi:glycoside hydrolase family 113 [Roseivirga sp.]|uniref:glycoside hydrolase family 113 n=1 Tax=Roseivirga sp. TaxID=1964215 RepID=UPI003B52CDBC
MKSRKLSVLIAPILIVLVGYLLLNSSEEKHPVSINAIHKHRGVCWVASPYQVDSTSILDLKEKNINWISQTPFGWQREFNSPKIGNQIGREDGWWGESDKGIRQTTRVARQYGIHTILKPHIWLRDSQGKWRGEIRMESEEDWKAWFQSYEEFILHYAQLAEEESIEMLCIGTELHRTCVEREQDWRNLIRKIREVYSGGLTYAANFADEYEEVAFWDELDYIGIQGYFPVVETEEPTIQEVKEGWSKHLKTLEKFSARYKKPILFTEIGYKSTSDAGIEPWQWPQRLGREERAEIYSEETQAVLYRGMFESLADQPFIAGFHLWKWYPPVPESAEIQRRRRDDGAYNVDFTPQGKAAEQVMKEWFGRMSQ